MCPSHPPALKRRTVLFCYTSAFFLLLSWITSPSRDLCLALDQWVALMLNRTLPGHRYWQEIVAISNHRFLDWSILALLAAYLLRWCRQTPTPQAFAARSAVAVYALVILLFSIVLGKAVLSPCIRSLGLQRQSPSLELDGLYLLAEHIRWLKVKGHAGDCFPSDHGSVILVVASLILHFRAPSRFFPFCLLVAIALLPRMLSASHWLSDYVLGSFVYALCVVPPFLMDPLYTRCLTALQQFFRKAVENTSWQPEKIRL
jgi:membrane-associated phospholipid phosphatase